MFENFEFPHVHTYEGDLGWLIHAYKKLIKCCEEVHITDEELQKQINDIKKWIQNFNPTYIENVIKSILATMIFVEITDSGYIVYNIPDSWETIIFNTTGLDIAITGVEYGHLVLSY